MGVSEQRHHPADTQEFVAMWTAAKEEHFVQELAPLLPLLLRSRGELDEKKSREVARDLVRALHHAARPDGGLHAAMDYLTKVAGKGSDR
ncbi:MAG TPA: hypothetical protein VFZ87_03885 [Gemmatimonadales bacterium]